VGEAAGDRAAEAEDEQPAIALCEVDIAIRIGEKRRGAGATATERQRIQPGVGRVSWVGEIKGLQAAVVGVDISVAADDYGIAGIGQRKICAKICWP
jgi:hypothetical protein